MPKNVVFLHLESVSQMSLRQYADEAPVLLDLMHRSTSFSRFYATATSSVMSMSDLLHGDSSELDHLELFPKGKGGLRRRAKNLMDTLRERGYAAHGVHYCSFPLRDVPHNFWGVWPDACGQFAWHKDRDELHRDVGDFMAGAKARHTPFALYLWNMNTHLQDEDELKGRALPYHERFRAAYRLLDRMVGRLLGDLAALDLLDDTIVVGVGDHGDDVWRHGLYRGRSHIIDPYATVCWCPWFLFEHGKAGRVLDSLASTVDVKPTLSRLLFPDAPPEEPASAFAGVDLFSTKRDAAFSQCMFALQRERTDPAKSITKSYAVTDGDHRLMVSGSAEDGDSGGMELYLDQWDCYNTTNILRFCDLDASGGIAAFREPGVAWPGYPRPAGERQRNALRDRHSWLRRRLRAFVRDKEEDAKKDFVGEERHVFPEELFHRVRVKNW